MKTQLWSTLHEYPLKDCNALNVYISESVRTCWSFCNHQPSFRLDYSNTKYDVKLHERTDKSNKQNDHIVQYIWPSLVDSSDNSCLSRGIVITWTIILQEIIFYHLLDFHLLNIFLYCILKWIYCILNFNFYEFKLNKRCLFKINSNYQLKWNSVLC